MILIRGYFDLIYCASGLIETVKAKLEKTDLGLAKCHFSKMNQISLLHSL
jgi:hypothetical protein